MGRGDGGRRQKDSENVDMLDMKNMKAARHWLRRPPPKRSKQHQAKVWEKMRRPVQPAEPWWPGGCLDTVQQSEGILPAVGWLCVKPREERSPVAPSTPRLVQIMRPYKCGPERVYNTPGAKRSKPRDSLPSLPSLEPRIASKATSRAASPEPSEGGPAGPEQDVGESAVGQFRQVVQSLSSISSMVTSMKTTPLPRRRSSDRSIKAEKVEEKDDAKMRANLEAKNRQAQRREKLLRSVFDALLCQAHAARRARQSFSSEELSLVRQAFARCAGDREELCSENQLLGCLMDLGLTGSSVKEKREVWRQIAEAFRHPWPHDEPEPEELVRQEEKLQALVKKRGDGVSEQDLILYVIPSIRTALQELCEEEMDQRLHRLQSGDRDVSSVPLKLLARVARLMGVDSQVFLRSAEQLAEGGTHISLLLAAKALVFCREKVAQKLRRKELKLKELLFMTEAKTVCARPQLLELQLRFNEYEPRTEGDLEILTEDAVFPLLKEMGLLPSSLGPDLLEMLHLDIMDVGRRFSFSRLLRLLDLQRKAKMDVLQEDLELAFAHGRRGSLIFPQAAAQALSQLQLNPVRREDQNDITTILAEAVGLSRHGGLNLSNFQVLCMRVHDRLTLLHYEAGLECGVVCGLSQAQVMNFWEAFHAFEPPLDAVTKGFTRAVSVVEDSMDEEEAPSKSLVTLDTSSMPTLANSFMTYISANAPRPQVQVTNGRYLCARLAERWTPANLRRALRLLRIPSDYVQCLDDDELASVLAGHFGLEESTCRGIGEALCLGMPDELYRKAQATGFAHAQLLGWEAVRAESSAVRLKLDG